ncbi:putative ribosomal protein l32 protein [Cladorrhinum sp. PSN332]|nr:putative ribosomal protein l32 protein [Cladorrhinum sp. PSN332]
MTLVTTTTMAVAAAAAEQPGGALTADAPTTSQPQSPCCPQCGFDLSLSSFEQTQVSLLAAQKQITDLQAQVKLLNEKATAAVDRWADYEDELSKLRSQLSKQTSYSSPPRPKTSHGTPPPPPPNISMTPPPSVIANTPSPSRTSFLASSAASRISSLLSSRKSTPNLKPLPSIPQQSLQPQPQPQPSPIPSLPSSYTPASPPPSVTSTSGLLSTEDLLEALSKEQARRLEVESRLSETSREVEELSVSLFEQANEMVATERRARAKLEERVGELERRDAEKRRRLEVLERGVERIGRVRVVLSEREGEKGGGEVK